VSVKDFGAVGDGVTDDTAAIQAAITACSQNNQYGGACVYLPAGKYKVTSTITIPAIYSSIRGDGAFLSQILANGVTGAVLKYAAITYARPKWEGFSIQGNSVTGNAIDFSALSGSVYDGWLSNLYLNVGGKCVYAPGTGTMFSFKCDTVIGNSINDHVFVVNCGPGMAWLNCYAENTATGKAGYRLTGGVYLYSCNGVNVGDYWGVFGQNSAATDGFQNDFPALGNSYPSIQLYNCNVENFTTQGILVHAACKSFGFHGGGFIRSGLSTAYNSIVTIAQGVSTGGVIVLAPDYCIQGSGVPNGGAALTNAYFRTISNTGIQELSGQIIGAGITGYYSDVYAGLVPFAALTTTFDVYNDLAFNMSAIYPRRLSVRMLRYDTTTLTPVGAGQPINVTGYTKVTVTPAAAASINQATFTQTVGGGVDNGRNGDLIIEAGNGNLTVQHLGTGASGAFRMAGAANVTMTAGQILRFCWSATSSQWIQV
jgi:hypothetical protein